MPFGSDWVFQPGEALLEDRNRSLDPSLLCGTTDCPASREAP